MSRKSFIYAPLAIFVIGCISFGGCKQQKLTGESEQESIKEDLSVPQSPTGELVSCPNGGLETIYDIANFSSTSDANYDYLYSINDKVKYYLSGNHVQVWKDNSICAEYTFSKADYGVSIQDFRIYTKLMPKQDAEPNRLYASFNNNAPGSVDGINVIAVDGVNVIEKGTLKHFAVQNGTVYLYREEYTEEGTDLKSYDLNGKILYHSFKEYKEPFNKDGRYGRYIKTTYYDKDDEICYYTIEKTTDIEEGEEYWISIETIQTITYDKNDNVISQEERVEEIYEN